MKSIAMHGDRMVFQDGFWAAPVWKHKEMIDDKASAADARPANEAPTLTAPALGKRWLVWELAPSLVVCS